MSTVIYRSWSGSYTFSTECCINGIKGRKGKKKTLCGLSECPEPSLRSHDPRLSSVKVALNHRKALFIM